MAAEEPQPWIGCDLDGTLAKYSQSPDDWDGLSIGEPVSLMVKRVKQWLADGRTVKIFTARVNEGSPGEASQRQRTAIRAWCREHIGCELPITNRKDYYMTELWDDRAIAVEVNTGRILGGQHGR